LRQSEKNVQIFIISKCLCYLLNKKTRGKTIDFVSKTILNGENAIQVSLAIRGGYVPGKLSTAKTKTPVLSLK